MVCTDLFPKKSPTWLFLGHPIILYFCTHLSGCSSDHRFRSEVLSYNLLAPAFVRPVDLRTGAVQAYAAFEWVSEDGDGHRLVQCWWINITEHDQTCINLITIIVSCEIRCIVQTMCLMYLPKEIERQGLKVWLEHRVI